MTGKVGRPLHPTYASSMTVEDEADLTRAERMILEGKRLKQAVQARIRQRRYRERRTEDERQEEASGPR